MWLNNWSLPEGHWPDIVCMRTLVKNVLWAIPPTISAWVRRSWVVQGCDVCGEVWSTHHCWPVSDVQAAHVTNAFCICHFSPPRDRILKRDSPRKEGFLLFHGFHSAWKGKHRMCDVGFSHQEAQNLYRSPLVTDLSRRATLPLMDLPGFKECPNHETRHPKL